ncbi:hypothetical protein HDU91_003238, partial [Kappamyces sp. JEL0680]
LVVNVDALNAVTKMHVVKTINVPFSQESLPLVDFGLLDCPDEEGDEPMDGVIRNSDQDWNLWALWEDSLQHCAFSLEELAVEGDVWIPTFSEAPLNPQLALSLDSGFSEIHYLKLIFDEFPLFLVAQATEYQLDLNENSLDSLKLHTRMYVANSTIFTANDLSGIQQELSAAWYRFLVKLTSLFNEYSFPVSLCCEPFSGSVVVLAKGGITRHIYQADVSSLVAAAVSDNSKTSVSQLPAFVFTGHLEPLADPAVRDTLVAFCECIAYCKASLLSPAVLAGLETELLHSAIGYESSLDEYTSLVFDKVVPLEHAETAEWTEERARLYFCIAKCGTGLDALLDTLLAMLQHPDYELGPDGDPAGTGNAGLIATTLQTIIKNRNDFVQGAFFTLCLAKHIYPELAPSRINFARWQSLTCCYARLSWLAMQRVQTFGRDSLDFNALQITAGPELSKATLLEHVVQNHICLDSEGDNSTVYLLNACHLVLSKLGWTRAHGLATLKEAAPIVTWAHALFDQIAPASLLVLLESLSSPTPSCCYLMARVWLKLNQYSKARVLFERAACGHSSDSDLELVIPLLKDSPTLAAYYQHVMQSCLDDSLLELAVHFGKLAVATAPKQDEVAYINRAVFSAAVSLGDFKTAFEAILTLSDPTMKKECLSILINELCEAQNLDALCGGFNFAGMRRDVETSLLFKTRTEPAQVAKPSVFHNIAYAYFTYCGDYRNAASVMLFHAVKLCAIPWSDKYGADEVASVTTRASQCFLTALTSLSLLDANDAFIKCPPITIYHANMTESQTTIAQVEDIRRMYHLSLAKLLLLPKTTHFAQTFRLPDPQDVFGIYCADREFNKALAIATLFGLDLEKAVVSCASAIVRLINNLPWFDAGSLTTSTLPDEMDGALVAASPLSRSWMALKSLLSHDSSSMNWKYHQKAAAHILDSLPNYTLPQWLLHPLLVWLCA